MTRAKEDSTGNYTGSHRLRVWVRISTKVQNLPENAFFPGVQNDAEIDAGRDTKVGE